MFMSPSGFKYGKLHLTDGLKNALRFMSTNKKIIIDE